MPKEGCMFKNLDLRYVAIVSLIILVLLPIDHLLMPAAFDHNLKAASNSDGVNWESCLVIRCYSFFVNIGFCCAFFSWVVVLSSSLSRQISPLKYVICGLVGFAFMVSQLYANMIDDWWMGCQNFMGPIGHLFIAVSFLIFLQHLEVYLQRFFGKSDFISIFQTVAVE